MKLTSIQFAWIYLVQNGLAEMEHSYYGGMKPTDGRKIDYYDLGAIDKDKAKFLSVARRIGVDWKKTKAPRTNSVSVFTSTFSDPERKETLEGELVLKNGTKQYWTADDIKVTNVFELMANAHNGPQYFEEIFGKSG